MELKAKKSDIRIDVYLTEELDFSRSKIQNLIKSKKVLVNDKEVSSNYKVKENDNIIINDDLDFDINIEPEDIDLDIVYEDEYLLVINKTKNITIKSCIKSKSMYIFIHKY